MFDIYGEVLMYYPHLKIIYIKTSERYRIELTKDCLDDVFEGHKYHFYGKIISGGELLVNIFVEVDKI